MNFSDNFFKKVENKTKVDKDTILSLASKLQQGNMKDEATLKEVINDLAKMTGREVSKEKEQKIIDLINIVTLLHSKTTMYKEIDLDNYKYIYEEINKEIEDIFNYYNTVISNIELMVYMSPSNYLIARNISFIYSAIEYAKRNIDYWYSLIENKRRVRVVAVHNNLSLDHYLKRNKSYLISWERSKIDMPIYDLVSIYNNHYLEFDFTELLDIYLSKYPLTNEELILFLTIISIPRKIVYNSSEYQNVLNIRRQLDYLYKTSELVKKYSVRESESD